MSTAAAQSVAPAPDFAFARAAAALIVRYRVIPGELAAGTGPTVEIYGDGRVVTVYPPPYTSPGTYERWLAPAALDRLLRSLVAAGVVDFDPSAVIEAKREAAAALRAAAAAGARPVVFAVSDPDTIELEVRLERYRPAGAARPERRDVVTSLRWTGVQADQRQHPDIVALQGLAAADQELRSLLDRTDSVKVD